MHSKYQGLFLALAAYTLWGCFPLFFSLIKQVSAFEVLANRIIWSFVAIGLFIVLSGRLRSMMLLLSNYKTLRWLLVSASLITSNWLIFIWAISQHKVMESSLGYFITPLASLVLGRLVFKEKMHPLQALAGIIVLMGVLLELFVLGSLPWVSLMLAATFALYSLVRKKLTVSGFNGLAIETLFALPVALLWLAWQYGTGGTLAFGQTWSTTLLLMASGIVTAVPLVMFVAAAQRMDLSVVGFISYLSPTLQFIIAVFVLHEDYSPQRLITFLFIWVAVGLFLEGMRRNAAASCAAEHSSKGA